MTMSGDFALLTSPRAVPELGPLAGRWATRLDGPRAGAWNMAMDEALLTIAATGIHCLRIYTWSRPTLSLGRHQPARGLYDLAALEREGVDVVRRPTGGRAVLHHREITYAVAGPIADRNARRVSYGAITTLLLDALRALGAPVERARPEGRAAVPSTNPCFDEPADGEIVARGRKLVGSAQWRTDEAFLQHGSILIENDQGVAARLAGESEHAAPATLGDLLGRQPSPKELHLAMLTALAPIATEVVELRDDMLDPIARTRVAHFASDAWTWRR